MSQHRRSDVTKRERDECGEIVVGGKEYYEAQGRRVQLQSVRGVSAIEDVSAKDATGTWGPKPAANKMS
jgi:hypothetical protein